MTRLLVSRLLQTPFIVLAVYTVTFLLAWCLPGPAVMNTEGRRPPPAVEAALLRQYDLDNPWVFYWQRLSDASGVSWARARLSGRDTPGPVFDFGPSLRYEDWTVSQIIADTLPVSVALGLCAIAIALVVGVGAGVVGAVRPRSLLDGASLALALIGVSVPSFVVGAALLIVFPVWLGVGRVGGWGSPADFILPAVTLSLPFAAYIARLTRLGMLEALASDYVRTARAKGLPERSVVFKHALKNAFLPVLSYLGPATAYAMTGSFVVELVFNVPGLGQHFVAGVLNKDLFLIMGVTLVYSTMLVLFNLAVDVLYAWVAPRIAQSG